MLIAGNKDTNKNKGQTTNRHLRHTTTTMQHLGKIGTLRNKWRNKCKYTCKAMRITRRAWRRGRRHCVAECSPSSYSYSNEPASVQPQQLLAVGWLMCYDSRMTEGRGGPCATVPASLVRLGTPFLFVRAMHGSSRTWSRMPRIMKQQHRNRKSKSKVSKV